jgi:membrane-associated phospholipid phosphatase
MNSRVIELRLAGILFVLLAALFIAFPQIDLAVSGAFFHEAGHWLAPDEGLIRGAAYRGLPRLGQLLLAVLAVLLALSFIRRLPRLKARRTLIGFLLASALLGPVLLVDYTLKGHFGRARPATVQEFGGAKQFTPAFVPSDQCKGNCSFVSGHVTTAAFIMAFGWLGAPAIRRRWLIASLAFAGYFAWIRIEAGGHFLSDTIFAWFATYFCLWLTEWMFRRLKWLPPRAD